MYVGVDFGEDRIAVDSSEINESLPNGHQAWGNGRSARLQDHALVNHFNVGTRIDSKGHRQRPGPLVLEMVGLSISSAELRLQSPPGDQARAPRVHVNGKLARDSNRGQQDCYLSP